MLRFTFHVEHPGERAAGIMGYSEIVRVEVEYGFLDPTDGEELKEAFRDTLREFYDGAKVVTEEEYNQSVDDEYQVQQEVEDAIRVLKGQKESR